MASALPAVAGRRHRGVHVTAGKRPLHCGCRHRLLHHYQTMVRLSLTLSSDLTPAFLTNGKLLCKKKTLKIWTQSKLKQTMTKPRQIFYMNSLQHCENWPFLKTTVDLFFPLIFFRKIHFTF